MNVAGRLLRMHDRLTALGLQGACACIAVTLAAYSIEVLQRYLRDAPTSWASDLVAYLVCFSLFLALPAITAERRHIRITTVVERMPRAAGRRLTAAAALIGMAACLAAGGGALDLALSQALHGVDTIATFYIPKAWLSAVAAYGFISSALHLLRGSGGGR